MVVSRSPARRAAATVSKNSGRFEHMSARPSPAFTPPRPQRAHQAGSRWRSPRRACGCPPRRSPRAGRGSRSPRTRRASRGPPPRGAVRDPVRHADDACRSFSTSSSEVRESGGVLASPGRRVVSLCRGASPSAKITCGGAGGRVRASGDDDRPAGCGPGARSHTGGALSSSSGLLAGIAGGLSSRRSPARVRSDTAYSRFRTRDRRARRIGLRHAGRRALGRLLAGARAPGGGRRGRRSTSPAVVVTEIDGVGKIEPGDLGALRRTMPISIARWPGPASARPAAGSRRADEIVVNTVAARQVPPPRRPARRQVLGREEPGARSTGHRRFAVKVQATIVGIGNS